MKSIFVLCSLLVVMNACDSDIFTTQVDKVNEANEALTEGRSGEALTLYREGGKSDLSRAK